jgi:hypothetical protein
VSIITWDRGVPYFALLFSSDYRVCRGDKRLRYPADIAPLLGFVDVSSRTILNCSDCSGDSRPIIGTTTGQVFHISCVSSRIVCVSPFFTLTVWTLRPG